MALRGMNFGAFPVYEIFLLNKKALHNGRVNSYRNIDWCRQSGKAAERIMAFWL